MSLPTTTQDLVKGVDFTVVNPQTASEHNQLVELSTPYTDGDDDNQGIALIITSTDTATNTPQVPNPTNAGYAKWKRYLWNRRPYATDPQVPKVYMWIDGLSSDATFLKWQLVDPSSYITVGGGAGTPLQAAIDAINTDSANALAAADSATAAVTTLTTKIGAVGATDLQTQVNSLAAAEAVDATNIGLIFTAISGDNDDVTGTSGINGQILALQVSITTGFAASRPVNLIVPSPIVGSMIRTNANASAAEWFNPASNITDLILATATGANTFAASATTPLTLTGTTNIPAGVYIIHAVFGGAQARSGGASTILASFFNVLVGAQSFQSITGVQATGSSGGFPCQMTLLGLVTVTQAVAGMSGVTLTATVTNPALVTMQTTGMFFQVLLRKVALSI